MTERVYRVRGTDFHGTPRTVHKMSEQSARASAEEMNLAAAGVGSTGDWQAEYADIVWKPLPAVDRIDTF